MDAWTGSPERLERIIRQKTGRAIGRFALISPGDRIVIGLSGGKDSLTLVDTLSALQRYAPVPFTLQAVMLGLSEGIETVAVAEFCRVRDVPFLHSPTAIAAIVFEHRQESNPCSLCAKLRRGALNNLARELGCNKVALGHHQDDVIETLLLGLFFEGRINTFSPRSYLTRSDLTVIRPLVFVPEALIRTLAEVRQFPVTDNCCPANGRTKRQEMKELIATLAERYPNLRQKLASAVQNVDIDPLWQD